MLKRHHPIGGCHAFVARVKCSIVQTVGYVILYIKLWLITMHLLEAIAAADCEAFCFADCAANCQSCGNAGSGFCDSCSTGFAVNDGNTCSGKWSVNWLRLLAFRAAERQHYSLPLLANRCSNCPIQSYCRAVWTDSEANFNLSMIVTFNVRRVNDSTRECSVHSLLVTYVISLSFRSVAITQSVKSHIEFRCSLRSG